jgi:hypothetical protein
MGEPKATHLTTDCMSQIGSTLIETLESYLPREQSKLSIIGCKVLDIFYEEFIKFVPAYILKREEEKKALEQQAQGLDNSPSNI